MPRSRFSLITYSTENLGDDIQTLAAALFLPYVDYYVDRECLIEAAHHDPSFLIAIGRKKITAKLLPNERRFPIQENW